MSATCPFCGAKLNLGLRFCVVCGRQVTSENLGKFSGLRGGFRPADITRRLDEIISVARFKKSRQSYEIRRAVRWTTVNTIYVIICTGLFYSAVLFSLELLFPGKFKETRVPVDAIVGLFNKHKDKVPIALPAADPAAPAKDKKKNETKASKKAPAKVKKAKKSKKKRRRRRRRRRTN